MIYEEYQQKREELKANQEILDSIEKEVERLEELPHEENEYVVSTSLIGYYHRRIIQLSKLIEKQAQELGDAEAEISAAEYHTTIYSPITDALADMIGVEPDALFSDELSARRDILQPIAGTIVAKLQEQGRAPVTVNTQKMADFLLQRYVANPFVVRHRDTAIKATVKEFAEWCGLKYETKQEREYASDVAAREVRSLATYIYIEPVRQTGTKTTGLLQPSAVVENGIIRVNIDEEIATYIDKANHIGPYSSATARISGRTTSNLFLLSRYLVQHAGMASNIKHKTADRVSIESCLKHLHLPEYEEVRKGGQSWSTKIRKPLEKMLNQLCSTSGAAGSRTLDSWHYEYNAAAAAQHGTRKIDTSKRIKYYEWEQFLIVYQVAGNMAEAERAAAKMAKKDAEMKKKSSQKTEFDKHSNS